MGTCQSANMRLCNSGLLAPLSSRIFKAETTLETSEDKESTLETSEDKESTLETSEDKESTRLETTKYYQAPIAKVVSIESLDTDDGDVDIEARNYTRNE
jgi:hypothetical protein